MTEQSTESQIALRHFLFLAHIQIQRRLKSLEAKGAYNTQIAQLRLLNELMKEQRPNEKEDTGPATRAAR